MPKLTRLPLLAALAIGIATQLASPCRADDQQHQIFELRTYTTTEGNLPALQSRFRDHTLALFASHGMTNLPYWTLLEDQEGAGETLIYLLAHDSQEAAAASFAAFRSDPRWLAARSASEESVGGSLTAEGGVVSLFLTPTDFSPAK